jgi:hypothetical protein
LGASEPRLVRLCAPPGHGKTDFARTWARRFDRHAICDAGDVSGAINFIGRMMSALADESRGGESLALARLALHVTEADEAAWSRALLDGWKGRQERALLILENADVIATDPKLLALLGDMLAARPPERALLISSQVDLPLRYAHYLAPHEILTLSCDELLVGDDEALGIVEGMDLEPQVVRRMMRLANGWPIVLQLLARVAHYETNIEAFLDRLGDARSDILECLLREMVSALTPDMMSTLLAVAAIPHATLEDIAAATGIEHPGPIVDRLLHLPAFVSYNAGTYHVHPLLHSLLRAQHESDFVEYVHRAAIASEDSSDFLRAAELFCAHGDVTAAAAALDKLPMATLVQPSNRLVGTLAKVPVRELCARPNLWMATLRFRRYHVDALRLYGEAAALQGDATTESGPMLRRRLGVRRAMLAHQASRLGEAHAILEGVVSTGELDETAEERRLILMTSAVVAAKRGRLTEAERFVEQADAVPGARQLAFDEERAQIAIEKARLHGDWEDVLKHCDERLAAAQQAGTTARILEAARDVALAAWCCGDDERAAAAQAIARECGDSPPLDATPAGTAIAEWQAALASRDRERAEALVEHSIESIDRVENDFLRILIRVGAALLVPAQRRRLIEARALAERIESIALQASIELLIDAREPADHGIFKNLALRVSRSPLKRDRASLYVDVRRGELRRGNEALHVSDRGLELLAALTLFRAATSDELAATIWPRLDPKAALNSLKMCVSRTRAQVGDRDVIQNTRIGYALGEHVGSDVLDLEELVRDRRGATMGAATRRRARETLSAWGSGRSAHATEWSWSSSFEAHVGALQRELLQILGEESAGAEEEPALAARS